MKYICWFRFFIIATICSLTSHACMSQESFAWEGDYLYQEQLGNTVGGSPMLIDMHLRIKVDGSCLLSINGYQMSEKIVCKTTPQYPANQISFVSYDNGKTENEYGVQQYQVGEVLFSLERSQGGVLTTWQSFRPDNIDKITGTFFAKGKTSQ